MIKYELSTFCLLCFLTCPPTNAAVRLREKFLSLMRNNLFMGVNEMCIKNITVTVSVRVSVTVRVSLV